MVNKCLLSCHSAMHCFHTDKNVAVQTRDRACFIFIVQEILIFESEHILKKNSIRETFVQSLTNKYRSCAIRIR
jgi:hypothetical protein